ncbi:MAG: hypothetical protein R3D43_08755 [Tepidamorphaceae bacterium]|nr:hypothetical protein [Rhodobiaceae bacterium]MCC0048470.1 hypothetical protein [Rhodobiaceae bacterium]
MKTALTILLAFAALEPFSLSARADELADKGREISQTHCSRCHVIGDYNPFGGVSSTPSFQLVVNKLADWEERFSTFYTRRPHPAIIRIEGTPAPVDEPMVVPIEFKLEDVDAIVAFARTLKKQD